MRKLNIGGDRGLDIEVYPDRDWRDWSIHIWVGRHGMHAFATRGRLARRIYFETARA